MDLADFGLAGDVPRGQFDYIIAHGFYSWVPSDVRAHMWRVLKGHLAPHGVAYISFNTLPGYHLNLIARESAEAPVAAGQGLEKLNLDGLPETWRDHFKIVVDLLLESDRIQMYWDEFADVCDAWTFSDFAAAAFRLDQPALLGGMPASAQFVNRRPGAPYAISRLCKLLQVPPDPYAT